MAYDVKDYGKAPIVKSASYTKDAFEHSPYFSTKEKKALYNALRSAEAAASQEIPDYSKLIALRKHIAKQIWSRRLTGRKRVGQTLPFVGEREAGLALAENKKPINQNSNLLKTDLRYQQVMAGEDRISGFVASQRISDPTSQARYYSQQEKFQGVMRSDNRQPLSVGDDEQYAFGADTGVRKDFDYLRQRERKERIARVNEYLRVKRAKRKGSDSISKQESDRDFQWWYDNLNAYDKEEFDLTQRYGGGAKGRLLAKKKMRQNADRGSRESASRASISTRRMRLEGEREFPMWKKFFLDSRNEAKDIRHMSRTLTKMSKMPLVGRFMHMTPMTAMLTAGAMLTKFIERFLESTTKASVSEAKWENIAGVWGKPSDAFTKAAMDAGLSGSEIDKAWAKFQMIGGAEAYAKTIGGMAPGFGKGFTMAALGWNEDMVRIVDKLHGAKTSKSREQMTASKAADIIEEYGWAPEMPNYIRGMSTRYKTPLLGGLAKQLDIHYGDDGALTQAAMDVMAIVHRNASTDDAFTESQARNLIVASPSVSTVSPKMGMIVEKVEVKANNADEFVQSMQSIGTRHYREIAEVFDGKGM